MKATGTKTDKSTSEVAMTGPVISAMAWRAASPGLMPGFSAITRSQFSTTTMASSTTVPMASTSARSDTVFRLNPSANSTAKVPISDTGTAASGISVARQLPRKTKTTSTTRTKAWKMVVRNSSILASMNCVAS
jgi:hypothetical protein